MIVVSALRRRYFWRELLGKFGEFQTVFRCGKKESYTWRPHHTWFIRSSDSRAISDHSPVLRVLLPLHSPSILTSNCAAFFSHCNRRVSVNPLPPTVPHSFPTAILTSNCAAFFSHCNWALPRAVPHSSPTVTGAYLELCRILFPLHSCCILESSLAEVHHFLQFFGFLRVRQRQSVDKRHC